MGGQPLVVPLLCSKVVTCSPAFMLAFVEVIMLVKTASSWSEGDDMLNGKSERFSSIGTNMLCTRAAYVST